jgi:hypothetical protein
MNTILLTVFVLLLNIPFGYWRANVKKFSLQFLLAIHIPVILIIMFRLLSASGFELATFFFTVPAFFLGQFAGSRIYSFRKINGSEPLTSCLVMDVIKINKW